MANASKISRRNRGTVAAVLAVKNEISVKTFELTARVTLRLLFVIFGCNGFVAFLPAPPLQGLAGQFLYTLSVSHYGLVVSGFQVVGGLFLLVNRFASLAIAVLAPVIVNILCFHIFMMPSGLPVAVLSFSDLEFLGLSAPSRLCRTVCKQT